MTDTERKQLVAAPPRTKATTAPETPPTLSEALSSILTGWLRTDAPPDCLSADCAPHAARVNPVTAMTRDAEEV